MATVKNIKVKSTYGVSGVEISLNLQELFQLSIKADMLGQTIGYMMEEKAASDYAISQLNDLGNFLEHILKSAGFKRAGRADIFAAPVPDDKEETE